MHDEFVWSRKTDKLGRSVELDALGDPMCESGQVISMCDLYGQLGGHTHKHIYIWIATWWKKASNTKHNVLRKNLDE